MNLRPVVDHLRQHAAFRQLGGAADLAAAGAGPVRDPACFVIPLGEQRDDDTEDFDGIAGRVVQFGVIVVVANRRDPRGGEEQDELHARRLTVDAALSSFVPAGAQVPPLWQRGRLVKFIQGQVWWLDEYQISLTASSQESLCASD